MDRRRLLRGASAAMLTLPHCCWAWPVDGARHEDPRLVVVFLRGAYDALSVVVPHAEPFYREARPTIAIPAPDASPGGALQLDARWALHPSLDALMPLWEDRQMSFIPFAGTEFVSRSHFDAQDRIECGLPPGYRVDVASGFLGRLRDVLGSRRAGPRVAAVGFASSGPLALRGVIPAATVSPAATLDSAMTASHIERVLAMYRGNPLAPLAREGLAWQAMVREAVREDLLASRGAPLARASHGRPNGWGACCASSPSTASR